MTGRYNVLFLSSLFLLFASLVQARTAAPKLNYAYGQAPRSCLSTANSTITRISFADFIAQNFDSSYNGPFVIPCEYTVFVDASVTAEFPYGLKILGTLEFPETLPESITTKIITPFVLVRGSLLIGKKEAHYTSNVEFRLTNSTKDLEVENESGNRRFDYMLNFGKKAFVVYGGQVELYGKHDGPVYVTLAQTAVEGTRRLLVNTKNGGGNSRKLHEQWKAGDRIAISPTQVDTEARYSSLVTIAEVTQSETDPLSYEIRLKDSIRTTHAVRRVALTDGSGKTALLAPVITKINRNIKISGLPLNYTQASIEDWWRYEGADNGGHFTIANTAEMAVVQGVELSAMGQPGIIGRYPLHAHFLADVQAKKSVIRGNSVHHSKQRCVVVHATDGMRIRSNVAFRTLGHCFLVEDGIERNNAFVRNVVISILRARKVIALSRFQKQSDGSPAGFWMSSPTNRLVRNVVGGANLGYWFEGRSQLQGQSRDVRLPGWRDLDLARLPMQKFKKNSAHAVHVALATYPNGLHFEGRTAVMEDFYAFTMRRGWQVNIGRNQHLKNSVFVDVHDTGVFSHDYKGLAISNTVFSGLIYNDRSCDRLAVAIEIEADVSEYDWTRGIGGFVFTDVHLQDWDKSRNCRPNYGVQIRLKYASRSLSAATKLSGVSFDNVDKELYFRYPEDEGYGKTAGLFVENSGGVKGKAFIVNSNFSNEEVLTRGCDRNSNQLTKWDIDGERDMYLCKDACWRQVHLSFDEEDFDDAFKPITMRFTSVADDTMTFDEVPDQRTSYLGGRSTDRRVNLVLPAGAWNVELIDKAGKTLPTDVYNNRDFAFMRPDASLPYMPVPCEDDVMFKVHGRPVFEI